MSAAVETKHWKLREELIALSESNNWQTAVQEWDLIAIEILEIGEELHTCLCGHYPIREVCHIKNRDNRNETEVGNCCVRFFEEHGAFVGAHKIFDGCHRLRQNPSSSANLELVNHAFHRGILTAWESNFYQDTWRKRKLTPGQIKAKININRKLLLGIVLSVGVMFRRIKEDPNNCYAGPKLINVAFQRGAIDEQGYSFYLNIWDQSPDKLTAKQKKYKYVLNKQITAASNMQHLNGSEEVGSSAMKEAKAEEAAS